MKLAALLLGFALATAPLAQEAPIAKLKLPAKVTPGSVVKGTLTMTFADGWHGYQNPPSDPYQNPVTIALATKGFKLSKVTYPVGIIKDFAGTKTAVYEGEITIPFEFVAPKKTGKLALTFKLDYQQCNENSCLPPASMTLKGTVDVAKASKGGR